VSVDLSQPGQLFSQLQNLAKTDPTKFKQVTAEIASQLKDAASSQTGKQADFLNNLAVRFQAASQSGKMSDLAPPQQGQAQSGAHHHHHHSNAQASAGTQSGTASQSGAESVLQQVQSIIANALSSASTSTG
jgi:HSP90 family molecular chaperone